MTEAGGSESLRRELFGPRWAERFACLLAGDAGYSAAGAGWYGTLLFTIDPEPGRDPDSGRGLFLDLAGGAVRQLRSATPEDRARADFELTAPLETWLALLEGGLEAGEALGAGRLALRRGSLFSLLPHLRGAQALLACARRVEIGVEVR